MPCPAPPRWSLYVEAPVWFRASLTAPAVFLVLGPPACGTPRRVTRVIDPGRVAESFRQELRQDIAALPGPLTIAGFLSVDEGPSATYADYTRQGCEAVGARFVRRQLPRLSVEAALREANDDPEVHGILVYYPVFGSEQDRYLRDQVAPTKDIEGLHSFWAHCLYANRRELEGGRRAILPCTPLAIRKLIDESGLTRGDSPRPLEGRVVCVFNRSEVVGRPLAAMLAHDGARVFSFDLDGPLEFAPGTDGEGHRVSETSVTRAEALARADLVVTGVPSRNFSLIAGSEIREGAVCINFSTFRNFADDIMGRAAVFVPRVGPMTVTMALRNAVRLRHDSGR